MLSAEFLWRHGILSANMLRAVYENENITEKKTMRIYGPKQPYNDHDNSVPGCPMLQPADVNSPRDHRG